MKTSDNVQEKYTVLQQVFGYSSFRKGQDQIIDSILHKRDTLAILPTGGGKSICYQIPALLLHGLTIIVSPLISLMNDQVETLQKKQIPSASLNSTLNQEKKEEILLKLKKRELTLLYVSPEYLTSDGFMTFVQSHSLSVSMVCVDEAHCVSQWGREFRPAYRHIKDFVLSLPERPVVCAFTATAAPSIQADITAFLALVHPNIFKLGFDRTNLYYEVRHPKDKWSDLLFLLKRYPHQCGIIYALTRSTVEHLAHRLTDEGIPALMYHGGMNGKDRDINQSRWISGEVPVIVATNAFGMGIDKPNVRFVIHYNMPQDLESYYQEAGRAGRDLCHSDCILLASYRDVLINRHFIEKVESPENQQIQQTKLQSMIQYGKAEQCLRQQILEYFGEQAPSYCGHCSYCLGNRTERSDFPSPIPITGVKDPLYLELRSLRAKLADQKKQPASSIISDQALSEMAKRKPKSLWDLCLMEDVTLAFSLRYGKQFLQTIQAWKDSPL